MPKHYKQMMDELINKMDEDAPANSVAGGGVDLNPTGARMSPKMMKRKKDDVSTMADTEKEKEKKTTLVGSKKTPVDTKPEVEYKN